MTWHNHNEFPYYTPDLAQPYNYNLYIHLCNNTTWRNHRVFGTTIMAMPLPSNRVVGVTISESPRLYQENSRHSMGLIADKQTVSRWSVSQDMTKGNDNNINRASAYGVRTDALRAVLGFYQRRCRARSQARRRTNSKKRYSHYEL